MQLSEQIQDMGKEVKIDGLTIEYGGNIFAGFEMPASELYGLLAAMIILVLAFINRKKETISSNVWNWVAALTIGNIIIAVVW